jgi:hypothetical protein
MGFYKSGLELSGLLKEGAKHFTGTDEVCFLILCWSFIRSFRLVPLRSRAPHEQAVVRNIDACKELAKLTRSSLGPNGESALSTCGCLAPFKFRIASVRFRRDEQACD